MHALLISGASAPFTPSRLQFPEFLGFKLLPEVIVGMCTLIFNPIDDSKSQDEFQAVDLPESYRLSDQHSAIKKITEPILESLQESEKGKDVAYRLIDRQRSSVQYATSFFWQVNMTIGYFTRQLP